MAKPTPYLRHVYKRIDEGRSQILTLQQWYQAEGWEHLDIVDNGGYWRDVEISLDEPDTPPADL